VKYFSWEILTKTGDDMKINHKELGYTGVQVYMREKLDSTGIELRPVVIF
jgi:hypothetical protein